MVLSTLDGVQKRHRGLPCSIGGAQGGDGRIYQSLLCEKEQKHIARHAPRQGLKPTRNQPDHGLKYRGQAGYEVSENYWGVSSSCFKSS